MQPSHIRHLLSATAFAVASLVGASAHAGTFSNLFVFGDSLSDSGNNYYAGLFDPLQVVADNSYIPSKTYASKTYSNGPVWASYYAAALGLPLVPSLIGGNNFASGGATTGTPGPGPGGYPFSLKTQTTNFLTAIGGNAPSSALYVIEGGGNNARDALGLIRGGANLFVTAAAAATSFAADVGVIVDRLQAAGAQHIVVWNTPDLGLAPAVAAAGPLSVLVGSFVANAMNAALAAQLAGEAGVFTFDIFGLGGSVAANPGAFGLTNVADACGAVLGANCGDYLYWDGIHPTTEGHRLIAEAFGAAVPLPVPEPETYALLGLGLVAVMLERRRRVQAAVALAA